MDGLIQRLEDCNLGCRIDGVYFLCLLYADGIVNYKKKLDVCANFGESMEIKYNCKKFMVIRIGSRFNKVCKPLKLWCLTVFC